MQGNLWGCRAWCPSIYLWVMPTSTEKSCPGTRAAAGQGTCPFSRGRGWGDCRELHGQASSTRASTLASGGGVDGRCWSASSFFATFKLHLTLHFYLVKILLQKHHFHSLSCHQSPLCILPLVLAAPARTQAHLFFESPAQSILCHYKSFYQFLAGDSQLCSYNTSVHIIICFKEHLYALFPVTLEPRSSSLIGCL